MRKVTIPLVAVGVAVAAVVVVYLTGALKPERPNAQNGSLEIPAYVSSIDVPVAISIPRIQQALESAVPKSTGGRINVNIGGNVHDEHVNWDATRSSIVIAEENGALVLSTTVKGSATLHWKTCPGGTMLPCSHDRQSVDIGASVSARVSDIRLADDWKLSARVVPSVNVTKAEGRVFNLIKVTFESDLEDALRKSLPKVQQSLGDVLSQLKIREQLEQAWAKTNHVIKVSDEPLAWMVVAPTGVSVAPVNISDQEVKTAARLVAQVSTRLGEKPKDPKGPFPALVAMPDSPPAFQLHVPIVVPLNRLSDHVNGCCVPIVVPVGEKSLTLSKFTFDEDRNRLIVGARFSTGWFGAHGDIYLEGVPQLSPDRGSLEVTGLTYDLRTQQALVDGAAELLQPAVLTAVAEKLRFDLRPLYESLLGGIRERAEKLNVAEGAEVVVSVKSVDIDDIRVGGGQLVIVAGAKGFLGVKLN